MQFMHSFGNQNTARGTQRVTERNRPTVGIYFRHINIQCFGPGQHHRGERFIHFEEIDIAGCKPRIL